MNSFDDLLRRLDAADARDWESEYSRSAVELTRDQACEVVSSERVYANWFAFRSDAGPPGEPLPTPEAALHAVLRGKGGTSLDAYRLIFGSPPIPESAPAELRLALLSSAAGCAQQGGALWLATWLAARAGLAAIALGVPEHAWLILDSLTVEGSRHPQLDKLATFEPLRHSQVAQRSPWVRATLCRLWPGMGVPVVPSLPFPVLPEDAATLSDTLDELTRVGATQVRTLVESFVAALDVAALERHADDPLVRDLRARVAEGNLAPPSVNGVPPWFHSWARTAARAGEAHLARLAGLLLAPEQSALGAALVLPAARAADLEVLAAGLDAPALQTLLAELKGARDALPTEAADALVAAALPGHTRHSEAYGVLAHHVDLLQTVDAPAGGVVSHIATTTRALVEDQRRDRETVRPVLVRVFADVHREALRLTTLGRRLSQVDVERTAAKIEIPTVTTGLIEETTEAATELPALERLLLALALRRVVGESDHKGHWVAPLAKLASDSIYDLGEPSLFHLRLRLLEAALRAEHIPMSIARLHFQRANTRRAITNGDERSTALVLADMETSVRLARAEGDAGLCATVTAAWVKTLVWSATGDGAGRSERLAEAEKAIADALCLPVDRINQAILHQAHAHLLRLRSAGECVEAFQAALALLEPTEPLWTELAAELVATLVHVGRLEEAAEHGGKYLERAPGNGVGIELGMLHLALGKALLESKRWEDARRRLESGLRFVRGRDTLNEALARLHLAQLGLATGDSALSEEHLRYLQDHLAELDPLTRREVGLLAAATAAARGESEAQRAAVARTLSTVNDERMRVGLRLEIAQLDLAAGRLVEDLDGLVLLGLQTDLDRRHDAVLTELLCNGDASFAPSTREAALEWARHRRPSILARLHQRAGQTEEARRVLDAALAGDLDNYERLGCTHQLMTILGPGERDERRALCGELERLLEVVADIPDVRLDLAAGLRMVADDQLGVVLRAREHARQALDAPLDARAREVGHQTLGLITVDLLRLTLPLSSPSIASDASWLLEDLALGEPDASRLRFATAQLLLLPGTLMHPDALWVAARLLDLVSAPPDALAFAAVLGRLQWVRDVVGSGAPLARPAGALHGPFDELPNWLVAQVHGHEASVAPNELAQAAPALAMVVRARPDVADRLLAMAISMQHELLEGPRRELLDAVYSAVQSACEAGNETWEGLRATLDGVRQEDRHPMLANIQSAMQRSTTSGVRGPMPASDQKDASAAQIGPQQRARGCFEQGVALMHSVRDDLHAADAQLRLSESRALLAEAVAIARRESMPELFDFLVSSGNAWKMGPDENLELALRIYEYAAELDALPEQQAKLWKVQADALRMRGTDADLRRADRLLEASCRIRRGRLLAETLMTRALITLVHPDLEDAPRERAAVAFAMDAVRAHPSFGDLDGVVEFLRHHLSAWERWLPTDPTPSAVRSELKAMYPSRAAQIDAPVPRASDRETQSILAMMRHPAGAAFLQIRVRLVPAHERGMDHLGVMDGIGPSARAADADQMERDSLVGKPDQVEDVLASLAGSTDERARPGLLAARVILLAYQVRAGRRRLSEVQAATAEAVDAIGDVHDVLVRSALLREVAVAWAPTDHTEDPVRDFALSADLLRRCVELEGGEEVAVGDTLAFLARALRYSSIGDLRANLREARRLYRLRLARGSDGPEMVANLRHNLAEVESQMGTGSRLDRLLAGALQLEEAASRTRSPQRKAQYMANLAWEQTQIGALIGGPEGRRHLEGARATFDKVDLTLLGERERENLDGNRRVCDATLARHVGGRAAEVASWREHLAKPDDRASSYSVATAKHNLASALMFGEDVTREELAEGLRLSREAAEVRTMEANPRHHWETSINVGCALLGALARERRDILPLPPDKAAAVAGSWLREAAAAAEILGPGEELLDAAFALCALAAAAQTSEGFIEQTEEAWTLVREASAYLLFDPKSREHEARSAASIAAQLARSLAARSLTVPSGGLAFVLQGESAGLVERWIVRAQQPARRPLQARLSRSAAVSASVWDAWQNAIGSRDQRRIADALDRVREAAPSFLAEEHPNEGTWRWLEARPGSIAVAVVLAEPVSLALLMQADGTGNRKSWVLGLELASPPIALEALTALMRGTGGETSPQVALEALAQWVRSGVVETIECFLGEAPSAVLWSPGPSVRLVPPSAVWRTVPVASTTSLVLPDLTSAPARRRSTLVMLADPGAEAPDPRLDLRSQGVPALKTLEQAAARRGPVRLMGSVGERFGRALLGARSEVRDTPASVRDVMLEATEHEVIVLIAHGEVETLEDAAVLCLDASGRIERLDVAQLGRSPDVFAGATVLLLSCEGGRMGNSAVDPGGLAGTLLASGAACVVAPLWPVRLDVAEQVGLAVLEGMASGDEPWTVLAKLHVNMSGDSPTLGRPAPSLSERRAEETLQRLAFVAWVG